MCNKFQFIIIVTVLLFFPKKNYSQAPNLGTASNFTLFTADGAFNNTGATNITGDVGTDVGIFTGFPPGVVNGQIHVMDTTSSQAATDVITAYDFLTGIACDSTIGIILGNNQILTPNVYCLGGAASTLNDTLFLDAQGDASALFIFKIDGALTTNKFSNIILINSASLDNVYWQINGALEVGDSAIFRGTILVNGAINLLQNSSLEGKGLSRAGAINTYTITATSSSSLSTLPIGLLYFNGLNEHSYNSFSWSTSTEINNDYFTLEKTIDAVNFIDIVKINGAGNSNIPLLYSIIDYHPTEDLSYYRLKQTDFDGNYTYSKLVMINVASKLEDFSIYPNPFSTTATIVLNDFSKSNTTELRMYNMLGKEMMNVVISKSTTTFDTVNLPSGVYFYQVIDNNKNIQSGKVIKDEF